MQASTLATLVTAARAGDARAREALFARAAKLAYARAARLCDDPDAAWDIAQEALAAAARGLPGLRDPEAFLAWLGAIVDRAAARYLRRVTSRCETGLAEARGLGCEAATPQELAEERDLLRLVKAAMASLPPRDRLIVELFYFDDMTCREVAGFLKTTRGAVKMVLQRSRRQLREEMAAMTSAVNAPCPSAEVPAIGQIMSSGPSKGVSDQVLFPAASDPARFYMALYPGGDARSAAARAGLAPEQAAARLQWLQERTLLSPDGDGWRCTMPVMLARDLELVLPWAREFVAPVVVRLDDLRRELEGIAAEFEPGPGRETVMAAGLYAEVARRPLWRLTQALGAAPTQRGDFGECTAAAVAGGVAWPRGYLGGLGSGTIEKDSVPVNAREYALGPEGTDKSRLTAFLTALGQADAGDLSQGLRGFLCSLSYDPLHPAQVLQRAADFGLQVSDPQWFIEELAGLSAIAPDGETIRLRVPVIPAHRWDPFVHGLEALGDEMLSPVPRAAEDLRARLARCSFADCNYQDSAALCIGLAVDVLAAAINERGWVRFPSEAGLEWGLAFVL